MLNQVVSYLRKVFLLEKDLGTKLPLSTFQLRSGLFMLCAETFTQHWIWGLFLETLTITALLLKIKQLVQKIRPVPDW